MTNNQQTVLKVTGVTKSFQFRKIIDNISFDIKNGERIGLVGANGTGKTTLANIITGKLIPDKGHIEKQKGLRIGYLTQSIDYNISELYESTDTETFQRASELGLKKSIGWDKDRLAHLSGGERLKVALSMVWASNPGLLILDEPTNHLDLKGIEWLISSLEQFKGPVLIISHDRHFLDQTVNRILEIEDKKVHFFNGNYTVYQKEKKHRVESQLHLYTVQQRKKAEIEMQMDQLKAWSDKAHRRSTKEEGFKEYHRVKAKKRDSQVKSKMKRLQQELEKNIVEKPVESAAVHFQFENKTKRGKRIFEAKGLSKSYGESAVFEGSQFYISHGDRIGLLGDNGCGKTTLIKILLGQESPTSGELWRSDSLKIAYLSQEVNDLPENQTALEALAFTEKESIFRARTFFANLGMKEELITKPIGTLSLGERTRVKLVDILMKEYDVLILDEPTNHLDLPSREQLEKTLNEFSGTIISVSHDLYFLNKLCDKILVFINQKITRLEVKPDGYLSRPNKEDKKVDIKEQLMVIENRIATILGELSIIDQKDPKYSQLDKEFTELLKQKREVMG